MQGRSIQEIDKFYINVMLYLPCLSSATSMLLYSLCFCNTYTILRNRTIATIPLPTNVDILLSGCPLYDNDANEEIFAQVHNFIIHSNRFS